jgi:hypothetical protein
MAMLFGLVRFVDQDLQGGYHLRLFLGRQPACQFVQPALARPYAFMQYKSAGIRQYDLLNTPVAGIF